MKKLIAIALVLTVGIVFTACGGGSKIGGTVKGKTFKTEGWVNKNTFRLAAAGAPKRTLTNKIARRESSKRAAILNAQYQVLEKFKGAKLEGATGMSDFEMTGIAIAQEVQGVVKGGSVQSVTYDAEDNCEIIYEVKAQGLQKKVSAASWK